MTLTMPSPAGTSQGAHRAPRRLFIVPLIFLIVAMVGMGALLYPTAANWFATRHHDAQVSGYVEHVQALPTATKGALLDAAVDYNTRVPQGMLSDPFGSANTVERDAAYTAYERLLRVDGVTMLGELVYPSLGIGLPIYHGTSDETISQGVGHLYGSSLPVGGPSTHAVLTSHSGLAQASLFTPLTNAQVGDVFTVEVLGETRYYQVDTLTTVLPEQIDVLQVEAGADHVTLLTCTPIGVNSHRLLVRGTRISAPTAEPLTVIKGDGLTAGFPWWAIAFVGGSAVVGAMLFVPARGDRADRQRSR